MEHSDECHIVSPEETLEGIAVRYGVPAPRLRRINKMESSARVAPGQILLLRQNSNVKDIMQNNPDILARQSSENKAISDIGGSPLARSSGNEREGESPHLVYVVKSGDTVDSIAQKFEITPADFLNLNNMSAAELKVGDAVLIHKLAGESQKSSGSSPSLRISSNSSQRSVPKSSQSPSLSSSPGVSTVLNFFQSSLGWLASATGSSDKKEVVANKPFGQELGGIQEITSAPSSNVNSPRKTVVIHYDDVNFEPTAGGWEDQILEGRASRRGSVTIDQLSDAQLPIGFSAVGGSELCDARGSEGKGRSSFTSHSIHLDDKSSHSTQSAKPKPAIDEHRITLASKGHIFTPKHAALLRDAIPVVNRIEPMYLLYSLLEHGADMTSFYARVGAYRPTLILIETREGVVFGGFASEQWESAKTTFYGSGECFVFKYEENDDACNRESSQPKLGINVYKWTSKNEFYMWSGLNELGMGGGGVKGGFAFLLSEDMSCGTSSASDTFGNPPLGDKHCNNTDSKEGLHPFKVKDVEVWCFQRPIEKKILRK